MSTKEAVNIQLSMHRDRHKQTETRTFLLREVTAWTSGENVFFDALDEFGDTFTLSLEWAVALPLIKEMDTGQDEVTSYEARLYVPGYRLEKAY